MKKINYLKRFKVLIILLLFANINSINAQCINENSSDTHTPWTNIPYVDGANSYIRIQEGSDVSDSHNAANWLENNFTVDLWLKCTWPDDNESDDYYTFFSAGDWGDDYNSLYLMFQRTSSSDWQIRLSDGFDDDSNSDIRFTTFDYGDDFKYKWQHLTITYNDDDNLITLYWNGEYATSGPFDIRDFSWWSIFLGAADDDYHNRDFRGKMSGVRIWTKELTSTEIAYVWDKTFNDPETLRSDMSGLADDLKINMYTSEDNVYSLVPDKSMTETGVSYETDEYHPGRPLNIYNLTATGNCGNIRLDWTRGTTYSTQYIYRKKEGEDGMGTFLCGVTDDYFIDYDEALEPGQTYEYYVRSVWYNPNDPLNTNSGYYDAEDFDNNDVAKIKASLKKYVQVTHFEADHASTGNCTGTVKFTWDESPEGCDYKIIYNVDGTYHTLQDNISGEEYIDTVPEAYYGKSIKYEIDGVGDGCVNYSDPITAIANTECLTPPTNQDAVVDGDNISATWDFTQPDEGAPAAYFNIYRSEDGGTYEQIESEYSIDARSYEDRDADMCKEYEYKIEASNVCGANNSITDATQVAKIPSKYDNIFTYEGADPLFEGSKGYFNQEIKLDWAVNPDKKSDIEEFEIYRRKVNENFELLVTIDNENATSYTDGQTNANEIYEYLIRTKGHCGLEQIISDTLTDLGFRTSTGIVSGKITYKGGIAVKDVDVRVNTENPVAASSLYFDGNDDYLINSEYHQDSLAYKPLTFEAWIKPALSTSGNRKEIFSIDTLRFNFYLMNMQLVAVLYDTTSNAIQTPIVTVASTTELNADEWAHVAFSLDTENGELKLYLNGDKIASSTYTPVIPWVNPDQCNTVLGGALEFGQNLGFKGNIDEVKLWSTVKTDLQMKNDYQRIVPNDSEGLYAYWHFDESYGNFGYDISKKDGEFNKRDLKFGEDHYPEWSSSTPSFEQLHPSGLTDERGNYIIEGIRYSGEGEIFNVAPLLGVHEFDPTDVNLFISDNTPVHNNIDFTDVSSFRVTGKVTYKNTTIPVKDCFIKIDGNYIQGENNEVITTDEQGSYDIQVPIGNHYISVEKEGHVFVSQYFPGPTYETTYYFNDDLYNIDFIDNTLVKLAGRVVGGAVEQAKPVGSKENPNKNNLGICEITFTTDQGYFLQNGATDTTIYTDANTGMYEINLCPETYVITTVKVNNTYNFLDGENDIVNMSNCFDDIFTVDSVENESGAIISDTVFTYNKKKDWIRRDAPSLSVYNYNGSKVLGDSLYIIRVGDDNQDTISIAGMNGDDAFYAFGKPMFSQERAYAFVATAYETYTNQDNLEVDTVPVTDGEIIVVNNCANDQNQQNIPLNEDGYALYQFYGGLPNLTSPFDKKIEILLQVGEANYPWSESPLMAYVSGNLPTGNNFVTKGPDKIDYVLRDPPGSNSYAYLTKGLVTNYTKTVTTNKAWEGSELATYHLGNKITTTAGTPFFAVNLELKITKDMSVGFEHSNDWGKEHETSEHVAFNETFSTSSDPAYVGDMGDVFLGHSTNIIFGASNFIQISDVNDVPVDAETLGNVTIDGNDYTICKKTGLYLGNEINTTFIYSQNHIENYLIPNLMMLRNAAYSNMKDDYYSNVYSDESDEDKFLSNNDDEFIWGSSASNDFFSGPSYTFYNPNDDDVIDSVRYYNTQIIEWRNVLKDNEYQKIMSEPSDEFPQNISFDAGATYEASVEVEQSDIQTKSFEFMISPYLAGALGFTTNEKGFTFEMEERYRYTENTTTSIDQTTVQETGFVLEDGDQGDYFSVDVRKDVKGGFAPIFRTQGGQSSCPYEGASYTKYYNPGTILNQATMQIEKPNISAAENNISGVPETTPAVFELVLTNTSDTKDDVWFNLLVDASSNPYGAIVSVDGDPATSEGKAILVPYGQTVYKTLTIEKGQPDYNDIDSILVILHSQCQFDPTDDVEDIADSVYLSAHFVPACTSVDFNQIYDKWTANVSNNDTISFQITDYDINSSKFKSISFQTATPGSPRTTRMVFYKDLDDYNLADEPKTYINSEPVLNYNFDISGLNDGTYELYLKSVCDDGSEFLTNPLTGVIDRVTPKPFGTPEPGDGILSPGEDISLTFNEDVNAGDFYAHSDYIEVRGILNGTDLIDNESLLHDASIHFDGVQQNMIVRNGINLNNTSYTIEFWAKRDASGRECLVSLGALNEGLWIGFDDDNHFQVKLGNDVITSGNQYLSSDDWVHYAMTYNIGDDQFEPAVKLIVSAGATTEETYLETNSYTNLENILYVGYCPEDASAFNGNIHEFRIWNIYKTVDDVSIMQSKILNGHEQGLYGLWKMNDASGNYAKDLVFGRNAEVNATWQVSRNGKSLSFDGASYSSAPLNEMIFDTQTDFTFEFWFKTQATGSDMCMFSNGLSDGTLGDNSWNITVKADNKIEVQNKGISISFDASEYLDNNWQHFAMSLKRGGYLSIYMNGELVKTYYASQLGGFANEKFVVGARWWYSEQVNYYDKYFIGNIDELRIWNTVRQQSQIKDYLNNALSCDEFGLKAYFPFEDVNEPNPAISNETLANLTQDTYSVSGDMELFGSAIISSESPNIKLQKPITSMPFSYVINDDKVIITPNMEPADIENIVLDVSVKNVLDTHNNRMSSPATWTAYVDKNQMIWDRQNLSIEKYIDTDTTFVVNIQNTGGVSDNFEITNIPDWLDVSPVQGTLSPQETQEVTITVKSILNIGEYVRDINLVSSMGFNERLNLIVKVKAHEPDWTVNPDDFEYTANLIGQLKINDIISTDENDIVATFINGECRGKANVQYLSSGDTYLVFMDVYDNSVSGNEITFKVFDASTGEVYSQVTPSLTFQANSLYGSTTNPVEINATIGIDQDIDLNSGWSWVSFNVFNDNFNDLNIALQDMNAVQGDLIKSENEYSQFTSQNTWAGTLNALTYKNMYKIKASKSQTLTMSGAKVIADTVEIPIVQGWNWVGYPAHNQLDIKTALSSLNPENNDLIKSQQNFAVYDESMGWIGSLDYLQEGKGYMLYATNPGTIIFLGGNKSSISDEEINENINLTSSNMTLIAEVELENSENYLLKAYRNGELCGFAAPKIINDKVLYFITINGDLNDEIIFKAENEKASFTAIEKLTFYDNQKLGNLQSPYKLTFASSNIEDLALKLNCEIYPNPFSDKLFVEVNLPESNDVRFELLSSSGMKVFETNEQSYKKGSSRVDLTNKISNLSAGVYMLKIITNNEVQVFQIVKQ